MGTGIVSIALSSDSQETLSRIWLALATAEWLALALLAAGALARDPHRLLRLARSPASLTSVAATAVLGASLHAAGATFVPAALLAAATVPWIAISLVFVRQRRLPRTGSSFMLTVAAQSLAVLAALTAGPADVWLTLAAIALAALGLIAYPFVLVRFDPHELLAGAGDQWVAGGALAISSLAICEIALAASRQPAIHAIGATVGDVGAVIWIASVLWLPPLLIAEVRSPRVHYQLRRWSTLFPVGMYAASGFAVARVSGLQPAGSFARFWLWGAVALSIILFVGLVRSRVFGARRLETRSRR